MAENELNEFLHSLKYQINHKIQAGLPSEPLKNVANVILKEIKNLKGEKS